VRRDALPSAGGDDKTISGPLAAARRLTVGLGTNGHRLANRLARNRAA
jgi:hypothetical protein